MQIKWFINFIFVRYYITGVSSRLRYNKSFFFHLKCFDLEKNTKIWISVISMFEAIKSDSKHSYMLIELIKLYQIKTFEARQRK